MMGIIVDQDDSIFLQMEVETAFRTSKGCHAFSYFFRSHAVQPGKGNSGNPILYIYFYRNTQLNVGNTDIRANEVEVDLTVSDMDVFSIKIGFFCSGISIEFHTLFQPGRYVDAFLHEQATVGTNQRGEMFETFTIGFLCAVDIQMVRVGGSDDSHIRCQPVKRAVELVCLDHGQVTFIGQHQVTVIVLQDTSQESIAIDM